MFARKLALQTVGFFSAGLFREHFGLFKVQLARPLVDGTLEQPLGFEKPVHCARHTVMSSRSMVPSVRDHHVAHHDGRIRKDTAAGAALQTPSALRAKTSKR